MDIIAVILPVFAIAVLGYVLTWLGAFRTQDVPGLTRYVFNIALPIMLFDSMSRVSLPAEIQWSFLLAYYLPAVGIYFVGVAIGRRFFRQPRTEQAIYGMGCAYSNTVLIGLPIISTAWGNTAVLPLMMIVSVHTAILFSLTTAVAESGRVGDGTGGLRRSNLTIVLRTAVGMLRNPIFGGLMVGLAFNMASLSITGPTETVITWIRGSALPAALFVTGASLRQYRVMGHVAEAGVMMVLKLIVHPIAVWILAAFIFRLDPLWTAVGVVTAALPTGVNASVFASKYQAGIAPVVTATLVSTMLSVVSLSVLLAVFGPSIQ